MHISYTFISRILSYNLSYTILYFYLHSYNFYIRYSCSLSYVFHLFLVFFSSFSSMTYYILCTITYIISYPVPISYLLLCSGYTPMLYYSFLTYCFIIYFLIRSCIVIYFHFYCTVILYFPIISSFRFMTYCIPCTITYIFS